MALLLAGTLPTALRRTSSANSNAWQWVKGNLPAARRLSPLEAGLVARGRRCWPGPGATAGGRCRARGRAVLLTWALLLPYAVVWFFNFRTVPARFAIVPLLAVRSPR